MTLWEYALAYKLAVQRSRDFLTAVIHYFCSAIAAFGSEALRNLQLQGVKNHLLSEAPEAEFRWDSPTARLLAGRNTAADFFAYFLHPRKKVGPHRRGERHWFRGCEEICSQHWQVIFWLLCCGPFSVWADLRGKLRLAVNS